MLVPRVAILGAGGIAQSHAFSLAAMPYYYPNAVAPVCVAVASPNAARRDAFAKRFGFANSITVEDLWARDDVDSVIIASPNTAHCQQLNDALNMRSVVRVYLEKPVGVSHVEEQMLAALQSVHADKKVQVGFQFLQMASARRLMQILRERELGTLLHFHGRYLHEGYLREDYRNQRRTRLLSTPAGGALVDLGSHVFAFLVMCVGTDLKVLSAATGGTFHDVPASSDLCAQVLLRDCRSGAIGSVTASRISAGSGDLLELELYFTLGALRLSTRTPDTLDYFHERFNGWQSLPCGNDYLPQSSFPGKAMSAGWLRSLVHSHYLFFFEDDSVGFRPELSLGIDVQRLVRQSAEAAGLASPAAR